MRGWRGLGDWWDEGKVTKMRDTREGRCRDPQQKTIRWNNLKEQAVSVSEMDMLNFRL